MANERTRSGDHLVLVALFAGLLWGAIEALRLGVRPALCITAATAVSALVLATRRVAEERPWLHPTLGAAICGALIAVGPLSVLGQLLAANTHHRPLGAATFAVVATGSVVACVAPTVRLFQLVHGVAWGRWIRVAAWSLGVASLGFGLWRGRGADLVVAFVIGERALWFADLLVARSEMVERLRGGRVLSRLALGASCLAAIWLAREPGTEHPASIPLGIVALVAEK